MTTLSPPPTRDPDLTGQAWQRWFVSLRNLVNQTSAAQTYQDMTALRIIGATYVNDTDNPIEVCISLLVRPGSWLHSLVGGVVCGSAGASISDNLRVTNTFTVPVGASYSTVLLSGTVSIDTWSELR